MDWFSVQLANSWNTTFLPFCCIVVFQSVLINERPSNKETIGVYCWFREMTKVEQESPLEPLNLEHFVLPFICLTGMVYINLIVGLHIWVGLPRFGFNLKENTRPGSYLKEKNLLLPTLLSLYWFWINCIVRIILLPLFFFSLF